MDPGEILNRGRTATFEGRYEDALQAFIWFHEHALEHDRAYYGVRLSFALGYWRELADLYPPALEALEAAGVRAEATLINGQGDRDLFHDAEALNRELGRPANTYRLFVNLKKQQAELAKKCASLAIESIVEAGDYKLASEHLPHPETYLLWLSDRLNADLSERKLSHKASKMRREAYVRNYCHDVRTTLRILKGLRNLEAAQAALEWAIALVEPPIARAIVCAQLTSNDLGTCSNANGD